MLPLPVIIEHSLVYGGVLSAFMSAVIIATLYWCPGIWLSDAPAEVQRAAGPMSPRDQRIRRVIGVPTLLVVAAILIHSVVRLAGLAGGQAGFWEVALSTFLIVQVFNLVDLVLIDWLLIVALRPAFLRVPGTEGMAGPGAYLFHFQAFLKGVAGSLVASLLLAGVATLLTGLLRLAGVVQ